MSYATRGPNKFKVKLLGIILVQSGSIFYTDVFSPNCIINATALFEFQKKSLMHRNEVSTWKDCYVSISLLLTF